MDKRRIIPCLDIRDNQVVKGVNFENIREVGDPCVLAASYSEAGADELMLLDITATAEGRVAFTSLVSQIAEVVSIPITVGGGIQSVDAAKALLDSGARRISVSSHAVANPSLIDALVKELGSEKVVCAIDAQREEDSWQVVTRGGKHRSGKELLGWATEVSERGAGELLITSMAADGVRGGFDLALYQAVESMVSTPLIASGGAGSMEHFATVFQETGVSAALGASIFHFGVVNIAKLKHFLLQCDIPILHR